MDLCTTLVDLVEFSIHQVEPLQLVQAFVQVQIFDFHPFVALLLLQLMVYGSDRVINCRKPYFVGIISLDFFELQEEFQEPKEFSLQDMERIDY